jgi:hypothetical protein
MSRATITTNLQILTPSRRAMQPGDLFVMRLHDRVHFFGRVVNTEAWAGWGMPHAILIYIYDTRSELPEPPDRAALKRDRLLVPPMMTNRLPWSRGYFEMIEHVPLQPDDVYQPHCFEDVRGKCYDEFTNELRKCIEPCGDWGLHSFRTIDDAVSRALGIPLAPE